MSAHELILTTDGRTDLEYALSTYMIYPWVRDADTLVRPLRIGPKDEHVAVARVNQTGPAELTASVNLDDSVPDGLAQVRQALERCLQVNYPGSRIEALAAADPVLNAAVQHRGYGRGKLYPELFEALCGVVCAKRMHFSRVTTLMRNLATTFGDITGETVDGDPVHAFPTPAQMADATEEELRACKVGFRAKDLTNVAVYLSGVGYSWYEWRHRDTTELLVDLQGIRGVGPYTANLAVNLVYGGGGVAHVDTYVVDVIGRLYLDNPEATPEEIAAFIDTRWGGHGELVLDYLTTDTEQWVTTLGKTVGVRSGARA